jgi:hypothetical protein
MKTVILLLFCSSIAFSQSLYYSPTYHHSPERDYFGVSSSIQLLQIHKVFFRGVARGFVGTEYHKPFVSAQRIEVGLEDKNVMITGQPMYNVLELTYNIHWLNNLSTRYQWSFGFGIGFHWNENVAFTMKYITGFDHGVRLSLEYPLFSDKDVQR